MSICPHCSQRIDSQAIYCTYCHKPLKAYGHPGIPLYQASDAEFLCDRCLYHEDDTCTYPQRPYAKTCTLFHDKSQPLVPETITTLSPANSYQAMRWWCSRNKRLLIILVLVSISLLAALL